MIWWNVYIGRNLIDSVPYQKGCNKEYVRRSLIEHDGYDLDIVVKKARK